MPLKPYLAIIETIEKLNTNDLKNKKKIMKGIPIIDTPNNQIIIIDIRNISKLIIIYRDYLFF